MNITRPYTRDSYASQQLDSADAMLKQAITSYEGIDYAKTYLKPADWKRFAQLELGDSVLQGLNVAAGNLQLAVPLYAVSRPFHLSTTRDLFDAARNVQHALNVVKTGPTYRDGLLDMAALHRAADTVKAAAAEFAH